MSSLLDSHLVYYSLFSLLLVIGSTYCDHLHQSQDKPQDYQEQSDDSTHKHQSKTSDPEYIKKELKDLIFTKIDADKDSFVSYEELKKYLADLHEKNIEYNVDKQWIVYSPQIHEVFSWEGYEPERREVLTWDHYFNQTYPELNGIDVGIPINREQDTSRLMNSLEQSNEGEQKAGISKVPEEDEDPHMRSLKLMVRRADSRWKLADENGDTLLTKDEFKLLLHPDEGNEELQGLFVKEATEDMDTNKDGKICLEEFMKHLQILASDQEKEDQSWLASQQENFGRFLDKNKDGVLDGDEIRDWLVPSKAKKFEAEAKRLLDIGDGNEDHKLSNVEILENFDQYISLLPAEYWNPRETIDISSRKYDSDLGHDEL